MNWRISLAFLLSGAAGLMHEIVWSKLLSSLIGTTAHAQAAVLVVYMGGLAIGAVIFGRDADRRGHSLRTYMQLEVAIAGYCLVLPVFLAVASTAYVWVAGYAFESAQLKFGLRFAMALLTVITPAVMMGGTLPLLARHVIHRPGQARRRVAALYALNNLGAVIGAALAGFGTLPAFGVYASLVIASAVNLVAGVLVWPQIGTPVAPAARGAGAREDAERGYGASTYRVTLLALFMSGFAAMAYEVVFIRIIALAFGGTTYSFTVMLMSFITGIGLGSLAVMQLRIERPLWLLGVSQLVAAVAFLAATPLMERLPYYVGLVRIAATEAGPSFAYYQAGNALLCLAALLLPTMCVGASFPLVAAVQAQRPSRIGSLIGGTYACNTAGNVSGILITTLVLLPTVGMLGSFHVAIAFSIAAGLVVLSVASDAPATPRIAAVAAVVLALTVYAAKGLDWPIPLIHGANHMRLRTGPPPGAEPAVVAEHGSSSFEAWKRWFVQPAEDATIAALREDSHTNVMVVDNDGLLSLVVNAKADASTGGDMETQLLLAHVPLLLNAQARSVLVIGYGAGITIGSALRHPVERADVVEISQGVLDVAPIFAPYNYDAMHDPRMTLYADDAQSFLRVVPRTYDVIISQPSNPWISGIAGLFTVEFFEIARRKLAPGGVFCLWFHEYEQTDEAVRLILDTFRAVFPHVSLFAEQTYYDAIAIGSVDPLAVDFAGMEDRFDLAAVRNDLARIGISNVVSFLGHHTVPAEVVAREFGGGPVNRALEQRLEYLAAEAMFLGVNSSLVDDNSPLLHGEGGTLVDDYIAFRDAAGEPVRKVELDRAGRHLGSRASYATEFRAAFAERAKSAAPAASPATRASRGASPDPATAGSFEAALWADLLKTSDPATAAAFSDR